MRRSGPSSIHSVRPVAPATAGRAVAARAVAALLSLALASAATAATPGFKKPRKALPEGWDAAMRIGADATRGAARTSSFHGGVDATFRSARWEYRLAVEAKRSAWTGGIKRTDEDGRTVVDADGEPVLDVVTKRTFDRRFVEFEPRWFVRQRRNYLFALVDVETNEPAGLKRTSRQIAGVGYSLVADKRNWFTAGIGYGRKTDLNVVGEGAVDGIGYGELALSRQVGERTTFKASLDSDFGSENRSTGLDLALKWKLDAPISLKIDYETRVNRDESAPSSPFDGSRNSSVSISLEIDVL